MNLYVGTSGFSYKEWKGSFYPKDLADKNMLRFYGERLRTVEINNTFYRLPKAEVLEAWGDEVPVNFHNIDTKLAQLAGAAGELRRIEHVRRLVHEFARQHHAVDDMSGPGKRLPRRGDVVDCD